MFPPHKKKPQAEEFDPLAPGLEELDSIMEFARKKMGGEMSERLGKKPPMPVDGEEAKPEDPEIPGVEASEETPEGEETAEVAVKSEDPELLRKILESLKSGG